MKAAAPGRARAAAPRGTIALGRRRAVAVLAAAALAGCAAPSGPLVGDDAVRVAHVPFIDQPDWQCGPASLAMAAAAAGRPVPVEDFARAAFVPGRAGSLQPEMLAAPRRHGLLATELTPGLAALREELRQGRPVVVLQNLGLAAWPVWHYAVVVGLDEGEGRVELHSGDTRSLRMPLSTFDRTWARAGRWALVLTPPTRLPAAIDLPRAMNAAAGLQRVDAQAGAQAWESVHARWPEDRRVRFGRANALLAIGRAADAAAGFRSAIEVDPGFADAWNNLAIALDAAGDRAAARRAAERAVSIGGPRLPAYRDTLASLAR